MTKCVHLRYSHKRQLDGACSSAVERQIVDLVVVGSIPTRHPSAGRHWICNLKSAFVAQLDRATDFESVGCRFETCRTQEVVTEKKRLKYFGRLAQLVEQQTLNLWVRGSSPRSLMRI